MNIKKVYLKAANVKACALKAGGVIVNGHIIMCELDDGKRRRRPMCVPAMYVAAAATCKGVKGLTATAEGQAAAADKASALEFGRVFPRRTLAVVRAAAFVATYGGRLTETIEGELEEAYKVEREWTITDDARKAARQAARDTAHPEEAAARAARAARAAEIVENR